jgi:RimJ/RimL family protein N-acetyltransferase
MNDLTTGIDLIITDRLLIEPLTLHDTDFILELVNTAGWLEFIGNRNINSAADATAYIRKIIDNPNTFYWVARLKENQTAAGIVTFIKRDYLEYHDIGFAFLPDYSGKGYAFEATSTVLHTILRKYKDPFILATTISNNLRSVRLLNRLQLQHEKEMEVNDEKLQIYSASTSKLCIAEITRLFYSVFTNKGDRQPAFDILSAICIPEVLLTNASGTERTVQSLPAFITPRKTILENGTLTEFEEWEVDEETKTLNHMAQRFSVYEKSGLLNGKRFTTKGNKLFQFVNINQVWKISSVIWEDE